MQREINKDCDTCLHEGKDFKREQPCKKCVDEVEFDKDPPRWKPKKEDTNETDIKED